MSQQTSEDQCEHVAHTMQDLTAKLMQFPEPIRGIVLSGFLALFWSFDRMYRSRCEMEVNHEG